MAEQTVGEVAQALEVTGTTRRLYIGEQAPVRADGSVPDSFKEQAEIAWHKILAQQHEADMSAEHLVTCVLTKCIGSVGLTTFESIGAWYVIGPSNGSAVRPFAEMG